MGELEDIMTNAYFEKIDQGLEQCPWCGSFEIGSDGPRTTYGCGSSCYDQRDGTWQQSALCRQREEAWRHGGVDDEQRSIRRTIDTAEKACIWNDALMMAITQVFFFLGDESGRKIEDVIKPRFLDSRKFPLDDSRKGKGGKA